MSFLTGTQAETIYCMPASGAALSNTTTQTIISANSSTAPPCIIPANFFLPGYGVGRALRIVARGVYSTTSTPTLTITAALDTTLGTVGTTLVATGAYTTESSVTNNGWELEFDAVCQAVGTSGTLMCSGVFTHGAGQNAATTAASSLMVGSASAASFSSESLFAIELAAKWGAASSSNTITCTQFLVIGLN